MGFGAGEFFGFDAGGGELGEEVFEADIVVAVEGDVDGFGGGEDGGFLFEACGEEAEVHVGDEGAEHEDAVGGFDVFADVGVGGHGTGVDAEVEGVVFGDGAFGEEVGGDGDVEAFGEFEDDVGEVVAVEFDAGEEDGFFGGCDHAGGFGDGGGEGSGGGGTDGFFGWDVDGDFTVDHVVGDFDVDGSFVAEAGADAADDFGAGAFFIEEDGGGDGDFFVDLALGVEGFDLVVEEHVLFAVFFAGCAGEDDDGALFGVGAGDGVEDVEAADAVGDGDEAESAEACVRVGCEPGGGFVGHGDGLDGAFIEPGEGGESEVAGDAEAVFESEGVEVGEEEFAHGHAGREGGGERGGCVFGFVGDGAGVTVGFGEVGLFGCGPIAGGGASGGHVEPPGWGVFRCDGGTESA